MAEFAAIGAACNVLQLIDFAFKVASEIKDFTDATTDLPRTLEEVACHVNTIRSPLRRLALCSITKEDEMKAFLISFNKNIEYLKRKLQKVAPKPEDSAARRVYKALVNTLRVQKDIQAALATLKGYEGLMTLYLSICIVSFGTMYSIVNNKRGAFHHREVNLNFDGFERTTAYLKSTTVALYKADHRLAGQVLYTSYIIRIPLYALLNELTQNDVCIGLLGAHMVDMTPKKRELRVILNRLEVPFSEQDKVQEFWNILRLVLEEWQRPWILVLIIGMALDELMETAVSNLPRSKYGTVILISEVCDFQISTILTHNPDAIDFTDSELVHATNKAYLEDFYTPFSYKVFIPEPDSENFNDNPESDMTPNIPTLFTQPPADYLPNPPGRERGTISEIEDEPGSGTTIKPQSPKDEYLTSQPTIKPASEATEPTSNTQLSHPTTPSTAVHHSPIYLTPIPGRLSTNHHLIPTRHSNIHGPKLNINLPTSSSTNHPTTTNLRQIPPPQRPPPDTQRTGANAQAATRSEKSRRVSYDV